MEKHSCEEKNIVGSDLIPALRLPVSTHVASKQHKPQPALQVGNADAAEQCYKGDLDL
jgi:hypothetical protein